MMPSENNHQMPKERVVPKSYIALGMVFNVLAVFIERKVADWLTQLWFTPLKGKIKQQTLDFWSSAQNTIIPPNSKHNTAFSSWGSGPSVFFMHGWRGSGSQFRNFVEPLVSSGFQVILFDAPGHGRSPHQKTHLYEYADCLIECTQIYGQPFAVIAHSIGCQAVAEAMRQGMQPQRLVMLAPGMHVSHMFDHFCSQMQLNRRLSESFKNNIDIVAHDLELIRAEESIWDIFSIEHAAEVITQQGLVFFDHLDEELLETDIDRFVSLWGNAKIIKTERLGHYKLTKDETIIQQVCDYLKQSASISSQ